jgi:hypothetical protein
MKKYKLEVENIGGDDYVLMSRGHHNFKDFMKEVKKVYKTWPMGKPYHSYFKVIPYCGNYAYLYIPCDKNTRGCFPVTVTEESYGDDLYRE